MLRSSVDMLVDAVACVRVSIASMFAVKEIVQKRHASLCYTWAFQLEN
jgi:hypothetical protein